ncbi:jg20373 [Pararge aegeria aegeria]|uniref:Jg20373 protein n=1 Tax=Pararge aegeria aegeria TaxID=348720 RepID=A0A8S4QWL1_9NEOP|nr:jg20373 [Pararge aegeria aegeria]
MSKRANESSLEFIVKKLRKLEKEVKRSRQEKRDSFTLSSTSSSSQSSESLSNSSRSATSQGIIAIGEEATSIPMDHNDTIPLEQPTPVENNEQNVVSDNVSGDPIASSVHDEGAANAEILDILGADPSVAIEYGPDINKDVATRFTHVATVGLNKDVRKELLKKFLVPGNCTNIAAPQLNAEIKATVSEQVVKRDKAIEARQKQIAAGISSLGKIISDQLCATEKNNDLIRDLMEVSRILCDIQHSESEARRSFALYSVKRELKDQLSATKIDKFLFGSNLPETIKTAKAVSKSSSDLKPEIPKKPKASTSANTSGKNLNWKARAATRRQPTGPPPRHHPPAQLNVPPRGNSSQGYTQRPKQTRRQ